MPETLPPNQPFRWNRSECAGTPLHLTATLSSGQSFRWRRDAGGVWLGAVESAAAALWQEDGRPDSPLYWQTFPESDRWDILADYFRLDVDLEALYNTWRRAEPSMGPALLDFRGLRLLRQPPFECLIAFQCATCNTVVKIERTVAKLAERYGDPLPALARLHAFPTPAALAAADEAVLRSDLWGYRAPRVIAIARLLLDKPENWLISLRGRPYTEAKSALMELPGIGAKVADCICLFALDKDEAVPVDTHIRRIASRLFALRTMGKSLTPRVYDAISDAYRERFGDHAGWAQQYLFFGSLRRSQTLI